MPLREESVWKNWPIYLFIYFKEIIVKNENQILEKSIHFNNELSRRNINSENFTEEFIIHNQT